jgi:hypothetical protein
VPLIVAHPKRTAAQLCRLVGEALGGHPSIARVGPLLVRLRDPMQ